MKSVKVEDVYLLPSQNAVVEKVIENRIGKMLIETWRQYLGNDKVKIEDTAIYSHLLSSAKMGQSEIRGCFRKYKILKGSPEEKVSQLLAVRFSQLLSLKRDGLKTGIPLINDENGHTFIFEGVHRLTMMYALGVKEVLVNDIGIALPKGFKIGDFFDSPEEITVNLNDLVNVSHLDFKEKCSEYLGRPIVVDIKGDGKIHTIFGVRRVNYLKSKKIKSARVRVGTRGKEWLDFKRLVAKDVSPRGPRGLIKQAYQPLPHPDFADWRILQPSYERLKKILEMEKTVKGKKIVDIGCRHGFFSLQLAKKGADVLGIDIVPEYIEVAEKLRTLYHMSSVNPHFLAGDFNDYFSHFKGTYDICLFMSIFHDLLGDSNAWKNLETLSKHVNRMYFDINLNVSHPIDVRYLMYRMLEQTDFTHVQSLGKTFIGRPFLLFTK